MGDVVKIIDHLLKTKNSIDTVNSVLDQLQFSKEYLLTVINDPANNDFFQLLRPSPNRSGSVEKLALTLDLFCCTHYATQCKNESCPFLHLCPYNVRHMHTRCTNKNCPHDHDVLKSVHNRRILDARRLSSIPKQTLHEITRASADPSRSFWVCNDFGKRDGCKHRNQCDKLHYCYFSLMDSCTKPYCQHEINDACVAYFRRKELLEQDHRDILDAVKKVLRQRKVELINKAITSNQSNTTSTISKQSSPDHDRKHGSKKKNRTSSGSRRPLPETPGAGVLWNNDIFSTRPDAPLPPSEDEKDIYLLDYHDNDEYSKFQQLISSELGCPIKLLLSKNIYSEHKEKQSAIVCSKPIYYYCPSKSSTDVLDLLRWQNQARQSARPLTVYSTIRDAHEETEQNAENQFCIFRINILRVDDNERRMSLDNRLELNNSSAMCFDRMWVYMYDL